MFLEYWMIAVLFIFLYFALSSMYFAGYRSGFMEGGVHAYLTTMEELKRRVLEEEQKEAENNACEK